MGKRGQTATFSNGQACGSSPINSDCDFDILQDEQIGSIDATSYPDFDRLYASTANIVIADDMPALSDDDDGVHCPRGQHCKRQTAPMSLYEEVLLRFQNSVTQITAAANQAYNNSSNTLIYGYNDTGPTPPSGTTLCSPLIDPWTWCDSSGQPIADTITTSTIPPSPSISNNTTVSHYVTCSTASSASCPNATFAAITAIQGTAVLHHALNGNIYSFSETNFQSTDNLTVSALFAGNAPFMVASSKGWLLHTYADTLAAWGVGRLRLSDPENMPVTSLPVALVPAASPVKASSAPQPKSVLTAVDTSARVYYLVTCSYQDAYSKIFLATSLVDGPKKLLDSSLVGNVTGEVPRNCQAVGYSTGDDPL
ncbi:MAG: hypothetical protein Q9157_000704 [Trypethelium eluteriae]